MSTGLSPQGNVSTTQPDNAVPPTAQTTSRPDSRTYRNRGQVPSAMTNPGSPKVFPGAILETATGSPVKEQSLSRERVASFTSPSGWWGVRDSSRPWKERSVPKRQRTIPPEQEDRWLHTRERVSLAARSVLGNALDVTHEALLLGSEALQFAPIPGLDIAAGVLLDIWNALQLVETNRLACLRLTERCADILLSVREEIHEAGDQVGEELARPVAKLTDSFKQVHALIQKQVHRPFLKRYLKRDEILSSLRGCDGALNDALGLFSLSIQIRTLKQLQRAEARRQADTDQLMSSIINDTTPKQRTVGLPEIPESTPPPAYQQSLPIQENLALVVTKLTRQPSPTPTPEEVKGHIRAIVSRQSESDHERDLHDLRQLMRTALATSSDADMIRVLQVQRDELPEAIKTLQRALEVIVESEQEESASEQDVAAAEPQQGDGLQLTGVRKKPTNESLQDTVSSSNSGDKSSRKTASSGKSSRDTLLDREFMESGIDCLRRFSQGHDINLPSWTITRYEVDLEKRIGIGFFSDVYRGMWRHHAVAIKVLTPSTRPSLFVREMSIWKTLKHPNVLLLLGASSARGDPPWFFVSPYMKNGSLVEYLKGLLPGDIWDPLRMVYEVAHGMEYLHKKGVLHGDLKGANVLIDDERHCVLADFGQSEMKSEAYRLSGTSPPHGTLRWQAPELIDGSTAGTLRPETDVFAFAIVCVEIFTRGAMPWGQTMDDDTVRHLVLQEDRRPLIPATAARPDLLALIETCWARDPAIRPRFATIVKIIRKMRGKTHESPVPQAFKELWGEDHPHPKKSPSLVPLPLQNANEGDNAKNSSVSSNGSGTTSSYKTAEPSIIPVQQIITPVHHDGTAHAHTELENKEPVAFPEPNTYEASFSESSSPTSATDEVGVEIGPELMRFESPPPADEIIAQRKNESRYRLNVQHEFHPSLTLPLWEPTPVALGSVGYLSKPSGSFITLFNSFDPPMSSDGRAKGMPSLYGYGRLTQASQRQDKRGVTQRGLAIIQGLLTFRNRGDGTFSQAVRSRYSFPLRAGHKSAYLFTESTVYRYVENLTTPKAWFMANIDNILKLYKEEHRLQREDVFLVIGTLEAPDYAMFVNHNNPDGQVHFNVFTSPKAGQQWGVFTTDSELPPTIAGGPSYNEDVRGPHLSANKVSTIRSTRVLDTVLIARLRFKPDVDEPTSL